VRTSIAFGGRRAASASLACAFASAFLLGSCGGGGGGGGPSPSVVSVRFLGAGGVEVPNVAPDAVPRNAWVEIRFSSPVDPRTIVDPNIQVRRGPHFQEVSLGTFSVDGERVLFDPTHVPGAPERPFGFPGGTEFQVLVPANVATGEMVRGKGGTPVHATFAALFTTTESWMHEEVPPHLTGSRFVDGTHPDGRIGARATLVLEFDEAIDPESLLATTFPVAGPRDGVEARYDAGDPVSIGAGLAGQPILVTLTPSGDAREIRVDPVYTWGDLPYRFHVNALPGLRDLAGNALAEGVTLGPWTCGGGGDAPASWFLAVGFDEVVDADPLPTTARWAQPSARGVATPLPITSRRQHVRGADVAQDPAFAPVGAYFVLATPLIGAALNQFVVGVTPPTSLGRRELLAFEAGELGAAGEITAAAWGPDRNATFAASYPQLVLRLGYQRDRSFTLDPNVLANYRDPPAVEYRGPYAVAQRANVGNEVPSTANPTGTPAYDPLFLFSGFVDYPAFAVPFPWVPGDVEAGAGEVLLLDVSCAEGDTWQDRRTFHYVFRRTGLGLLSGVPLRTLLTTFEGAEANPPAVAAAPGVGAAPNPMPMVFDTAFTIVSRRGVAQSRFYTPAAGDPTDPTPTVPRSRATTLGTASIYDAAIVTPSVFPAGTEVVVEYQGASGLLAGSRTEPDPALPMTPWTRSSHDCDGLPYLRWRLSLTGDLATQRLPRVEAVVVPIRRRP
jgi:hypothetical protein